MNSLSLRSVDRIIMQRYANPSRQVQTTVRPGLERSDGRSGSTDGERRQRGSNVHMRSRDVKSFANSHHCQLRAR